MNTSQPSQMPAFAGGFSYGVGVSIGVLLLITTITLISYFCTRKQSSSSPSQTTNQDLTRVHYHHHVIIEVAPGLDEDTIQSYPKILYSEVKGNSSMSPCCHICLGDYKGDHLLRQLPDCNHLFHLKCIDTWLRQNPTCPVCRTSPLPTPLAEVVSLASSVATTRMS